MNKDTIIGMSAGRELDELVAEHVFEEPITNYKEKSVNELDCLGVGYLIPNYSTDISAAWEVVDKFEFITVSKGTRPNSIRQQFDGEGFFSNCYQCTIHSDKEIKAIGIAAQEAICKASLLVTLESL